MWEGPNCSCKDIRGDGSPLQKALRIQNPCGLQEGRKHTDGTVQPMVTRTHQPHLIIEYDFSPSTAPLSVDWRRGVRWRPCQQVGNE